MSQQCLWRHSTPSTDGDAGTVNIYFQDFHFVHFLCSTYIFNMPTKCTYTIKYMHYCQQSPKCFGAYCVIFREDFIICSKLLFHWLQNLSYIIYGFTSFTVTKKTYNWFNVRLKMVKILVQNSLYLLVEKSILLFIISTCVCMICGNGLQSVLRGSQGIRDQFPGDLWIHFCNSYLFLN